MITRCLRLAALTFVLLLPSLGHFVFGQQPQYRADAAKGRAESPDAGRGTPVVQRAANIQLPANEGWQAGQDQLRPGVQRPGLPQPGASTHPEARAPFVLTPEEQQRLDQILNAWERTSNGVKTYKTQFTRWEYDTVFGPKTEFRTLSKGELKYMAPDKGMFRVTSVEQSYNVKTKKHEKGTADQLEHWVCDGKSVFEINHKEKTRTERPLPPELQGTAISEGPLPFVFGAKADRLKQRYWMRDRTPPTEQNTIWLEAYPRYQADAANFKYVEIIISRKDFMPLAIQTFSPGYDKRGNENRTVFQFEKTDVNGVFANFLTEFVAPTVPFHYKKIVLQPRVDQGPVGDAQNPAGDQRSARAQRGPVMR